MKHQYDLIIAGAGTAGCTLAKKTAEAGYRVALFDSRPEKQIGYPWEIICETQVFNRVCFKRPENLLEHPSAYRFYAQMPERYVEMDAGRDSF